MASSGGTSNLKLELSVQKLIAQKLQADNILIASHASDACVA